MDADAGAAKPLGRNNGTDLEELAMTISTLDRHVALIVVDLQQGIVSAPTAHPADGVIGHAARLAAAFRAADLPVVLVNVAGAAPGRTDRKERQVSPPPGWTNLAPALNPQRGDYRVTKHAWSAFSATDLETRMRADGVTQLVIVGIATSVGVESTARAAYDAGFHVVLPIDAMTDRNPAAHEASVTHVFPKIAETGTTQEVLDLLAQRGNRG